MNAYISDYLARERTERLLSDAAAARRARQVRSSRRAASRTSRTESAADRSPAMPRGRASAAAHLVTRPVSTFQSWLAAGQM